MSSTSCGIAIRPNSITHLGSRFCRVECRLMPLKHRSAGWCIDHEARRNWVGSGCAVTLRSAALILSVAGSSSQQHQWPTIRCLSSSQNRACGYGTVLPSRGRSRFGRRTRKGKWPSFPTFSTHDIRGRQSPAGPFSCLPGRWRPAQPFSRRSATAGVPLVRLSLAARASFW